MYEMLVGGFSDMYLQRETEDFVSLVQGSFLLQQLSPSSFLPPPLSLSLSVLSPRKKFNCEEFPW